VVLDDQRMRRRLLAMAASTSRTVRAGVERKSFAGEDGKMCVVRSRRSVFESRRGSPLGVAACPRRANATSSSPPPYLSTSSLALLALATSFDRSLASTTNLTSVRAGVAHCRTDAPLTLVRTGNIIGSTLSADCYARYCRTRNWRTLYICGPSSRRPSRFTRWRARSQEPTSMARRPRPRPSPKA
jgi:hypothetical protein